MFLTHVGDAWTLIRAACAVERVLYGRCGFPCVGWTGQRGVGLAAGSLNMHNYWVNCKAVS